MYSDFIINKLPIFFQTTPSRSNMNFEVHYRRSFKFIPVNILYSHWDFGSTFLCFE